MEHFPQGDTVFQESERFFGCERAQLGEFLPEPSHRFIGRDRDFVLQKNLACVKAVGQAVNSNPCFFFAVRERVKIRVMPPIFWKK